MQQGCFKHITTLAFAALAVAAMFAPAAQAAKICPQFLAKFCVVNKAHLIFTTFTNPCFASAQGLTVIYAGACKFGPVSPPKGCTGATCQ